jgi:hypothetical protein
VTGLKKHDDKEVTMDPRPWREQENAGSKDARDSKTEYEHKRAREQHTGR